MTSLWLRPSPASAASATAFRAFRNVTCLPYTLRQTYPLQCRACASPRWSSTSGTQSKNTSTETNRSETINAAQNSASSYSSQSSDNVPTNNPFSDDWENTTDNSIHSFDDLPHRLFGANQHMIINSELKEALRLMLRQFNAPIVYCFAYGSGVFPQESSSRQATEAEFRALHPHPPEALVKAQKGAPKMLDFIFGVTHTEHWHSINMKQHRDHYSGVASLGSGFVSRVQGWGAGVYFNPFVEMNGMLIKYGVTSIDNLVNDLTSWESLYLAGRLQKPVKILRDHPRVRLANQHNLIAAVRTALLLLPPDFTEAQLYSTIAGLSYLGDPRMSLPTENKSKVNNIVDNNIIHFRRLYAPLIKTLPNVDFAGAFRLDDQDWVLNPEANNTLHQDMDPIRRGNMVRRLPQTFRSRLYFQYRKKFSMPKEEFNELMKAAADDETTSVQRRQGGDFERRVATDDPAKLQEMVRKVIKQTVNWPSTSQSIKGVLMGGWSRTIRYLGEKISKFRKGQQKAKNEKSG
ncbi:mitochondrial import protein MMP37 [Dactylonectria macrodidyma]|uniref:Phosphatidate cytidylyltransferase, mitochondrial n=1 Tax=Dactylonectria macrodidyma TaxID=307937 RepID=A0A9P9EVZ8_9HYPO|nr:mitochondrial import protein MMP37 [Dactylonectria macrodidyma]